MREGSSTVTIPHMRGASEELTRALDPDVTGPELVPLSLHRDYTVRAAVAARTDVPVAVLMSLSHDHVPDVLKAIIANPRTPSSIIRNLADHRNPQVADAAVQRLRNTWR